MSKKLFHRPFGLYLLGVLVVALTVTSLSLLTFTKSGHSFAQVPKLAISPNRASPGSTVTVTGFEYPANTKMEIYFQNRAYGVTRAVTNAGGFFTSSLKLPKTYTGGSPYVYAASGDKMTKMQLSFAKPSLVMTDASNATDASSGSSGLASLVGKGFSANAPVHLALLKGKSSLNVGNVATDSEGNFTFQMHISDIPPDRASILRATGVDQNATIQLRRPPTIRLTRTAGQVGTGTTVIGDNFWGREIVDVLFDRTRVAIARANWRGHFVINFRVPPGPLGFNRVSARGRRSRRLVYTTFRLFVLPPFAFLRPGDYGAPGERITAIGIRFTRRGRVELLLIRSKPTHSAVGTLLGHTTASSDGIVRITFSVPHSVSPGHGYSVLLIDMASGNSTSIPFYIR